MNLHFAHVWILLLLPLALLPWLRASTAAKNYSWLQLLPKDPLSDGLAFLLRLLATTAIAASIAGLAAPYAAEVSVEHVGRGAQVVLLLDRSRSMDQPFAGKLLLGALITESDHPGYESKGQVARRLLSEFARNREHDLIGMTVFTTVPIRVIGFTQKQAVVQAAIRAGNEGRGLAETDIGLGLLGALAFFERQPYNGSRVILLVSDGGSQLDPEMQARITERMRRERVALYWLYLRANRSPGLLADRDLAPGEEDLVPEHVLHKFFQGMGTPYRAYEAEDPGALQRAVQDVNRLENLPIRYQDVLPEQDFSAVGYALALACSTLLLGASFLEIEQWR